MINQSLEKPEQKCKLQNNQVYALGIGRFCTVIKCHMMPFLRSPKPSVLPGDYAGALVLTEEDFQLN